MSAPAFPPALNLFTALSSPPFRPLHTLLRSAENRFRPSLIIPYDFAPAAGPARGTKGDDAAQILRERGSGRLPTIVLGGLVPDASEQVFLMRRFLLRSGDVYYVQYPRRAFSLEAVGRQLDELTAELADAGQPPVIFAVSYGAGVVLDWLRRSRLTGRSARVAGLVLISPVTCVADLIAPGAAKPGTLLGRALKPYLETEREVPPAVVEKSRGLFVRMFEAGAQNKSALRQLMTSSEAEHLHHAVMATLRGITLEGARQRARALAAMVPPTEYFSPRVLPLSTAPALVLFAEREDNVLDPAAPVRLAFERAPRAYFPQAISRLITGNADTGPVQHASLVFHVFEFLPSIQAFYVRVRRGAIAAAAA